MPNSNAVELFTFPESGLTIRVIGTADAPLFCHADVCRGLDHSNPTVALALVEDDDKLQIDVRETDIPNLNKDKVINPIMWFLTESGFYDLALASKAPGAKRFKRWVTHDVLPALRKTGAYAVAPQFELPQTFAEALELAAKQAREIDALQHRNQQLTVKAEAFDEWINGKGCYLVGTVAKMLKIGPKTLWDFLYEEKILINSPKTKRHREPYAGKPSTSWFEVKPVDPKNANGHATKTTYVLPYGAERIRLLLIKRGLLPSEQLALINGL